MTEAQARFLKQLAAGGVIGPFNELYSSLGPDGRLGERLGKIPRPTFDLMRGNGWIARGSWGYVITEHGRRTVQGREG